MTFDNHSGSRQREDEVLRLIEKAVLEHRLPPGTQLKEVQLADFYGVKRGTIRKVLTRLSHSRLVEQQPNRGATVAKPSVKEGKDLFAARRAVESAILEILIQHIDDSMIARLRETLDLEQQAYLGDNAEAAIALSVDFHKQLATMAGNSVLETYLNDIIRRTPLVILTHLGADPPTLCHNHQHQTIVDALEQHDAQTAVRIMKQHLSHIEGKIEDEPEAPNNDLASLLSS